MKWPQQDGVLRLAIGRTAQANWRWLGLWTFLVASGALLGGGNFIYPYLSAADQLDAWIACISLPLSGLIVVLSLRPGRDTAHLEHRPAGPADPTQQEMALGRLLISCLTLTLLTEWAAESWWPNSGDEYGYTFLARTLLHGRLWNQPPPFPFLFDFKWIFTRDHKWFSQYPPGWPALLAPFIWLGVPWLLNPLLNATLAWLTWQTLRNMGIATRTSAATICLLVFSPFMLFNGASLYAHTLTGVLIMGIVLLQTRDETRAAVANKLGIGALFGLLLLVRYEVFALTAPVYLLDRLFNRRIAFARDCLPMALGGLPSLACFFFYNLAITGRPFKTPYAWVSPGAHIGLWGKHVVFHDAVQDAIWRTLHWLGELALFASPLLICLSLLGAGAKLFMRRLRFYDVLFPLAITFFFFYPASGGHEYGPRYWYFAWPGALLSMVTGLGAADRLRVFRWRLSPSALAHWHLPMYLGVTLSTAVFTHFYVDARRAVYAPVPPQGPALVLIPTRDIFVTPFQTLPLRAASSDFPRNGVDLTAPILYGRADQGFRGQNLFKSFACRIKDRHIYIWREPGRLGVLSCTE